MDFGMMINDYTSIMSVALREARKAYQKGEVPVGAVMTDAEGRIIARAHNRTIGNTDPSGHAEIISIRKAAKKLGNYRLPDTWLFVTIEPCLMCMGAMIHARINTVVYGASDPKWGAAGSLYDFSQDRRLNHQLNVISGICEEECRYLIQDFFQKKRKGIAKPSIIV